MRVIKRGIDVIRAMLPFERVHDPHDFVMYGVAAPWWVLPKIRNLGDHEFFFVGPEVWDVAASPSPYDNFPEPTDKEKRSWIEKNRNRMLFRGGDQ